MDQKKYTILFVDDSKGNRIVVETSLRHEFSIITAESGKQGLEILSRQPIAVLLTDQRMPGISGVELAEETYKRYPDIIRVIITAYSNLGTTIDAINRGRVNRFIKKPWTEEELVAVMQESIASFHSALMVKQMQERIISYERIATLGIMASGIAHDLRKPLFYIFQNTQLVKEDLDKIIATESTGRIGMLSRTMKKDLDGVIQGLDMLEMLCDSLLDQLSNRPFVTEPVNLQEVISGVVALSRHTIVTHAQLEVDFKNGNRPLLGCTSRLSQLVLNLLLNAAQSIEPGNPNDNMITLRVIPEKDNMIIEVEDTGRGIQPEIIDKVFSPLFTTRSTTGSGLGLAICKQNVDVHGGQIEVSSTLEQGSCFRVVLPLR